MDKTPVFDAKDCELESLPRWLTHNFPTRLTRMVKSGFWKVGYSTNLWWMVMLMVGSRNQWWMRNDSLFMSSSRKHWEQTNVYLPLELTNRCKLMRLVSNKIRPWSKNASSNMSANPTRGKLSLPMQSYEVSSIQRKMCVAGSVHA